MPISTIGRRASVNTDGAFHVAQAVARHMVAEGQGGRIVPIASNAAHPAPQQRGLFVVEGGGHPTRPLYGL
ncbi:MAG: SDR family NAD(P)-dependent oxidoreductase [Geminicoccaceae bacterium]